MTKLDHLFLLKEASKYADFTEIYEESINLSVLENDGGHIERCMETSDWGCSLRSFKNNSIFFTASNFDRDRSLLEKHLKVLDNKPAGGNADFYYERRMDSGFDFTGDFRDYIEITKALHRRLTSEIDGLLNAKLSFQRYEKRFTVTNSLGSSTEAENKGERFAIHLTVGTGSEKFTIYETVGYTLREITPEELEKLYKTCVSRALVMKRAKDGPSGVFPVVLSAEAGGTLIHEAVGHGLEADLVDKGVSVYAGRLGEKVASELITVVDDGTHPNGYGSFQIDDEGVPSQRTVLVENGILKSYLYDTFYALKHKVKSTGNGRRQGYAFKPYPRMTNTFILPGKDSAEDLLKGVGNGVFVKKMGGGQVNTLTGDFIFEILEGYRVEKGEITYPLKNLSIVGNGPKVLMDIDGVADDFGSALGTCGKEGQGVPVGDGQPTIRIPRLTVGGKAG